MVTGWRLMAQLLAEVLCDSIEWWGWWETQIHAWGGNWAESSKSICTAQNSTEHCRWGMHITTFTWALYRPLFFSPIISVILVGMKTDLCFFWVLLRWVFCTTLQSLETKILVLICSTLILNRCSRICFQRKRLSLWPNGMHSPSTLAWIYWVWRELDVVYSPIRVLQLSSSYLR
jgi:hypothetical protein